MIQSPLLPEIRNYIDGRWVDGHHAKPLKVLNPANGEVLAEIAQADTADARLALEAAARSLAKPDPIEVRRRWLEGLYRELMTHKEEVARIITLEQGKPLKESLAEVDYGARFFLFFAENIHHLEPREIMVPNHPARWTVYHRPAGVVSLITPWNFPLAMFGKKFAPGIATGCGVVTKPASQTPLTAIAVYTLAERVGIPPGKVNLVVGPGSNLGELLCSHPAVRMVSCTGSTDTGKALLRMSANHVKKAALELGGNAPFIVLEDADIDLAVDCLIANKFRCAGQTCVCANRVYVQESIRDAFRSKLIGRLSQLVVGDGLKPGTDVGPLIDAVAFRKVTELVSDALERGATRVFGSEPKAPDGNWGAFYPPTLLENVTEEMEIAREEVFGPVISLIFYKTDEEVIERANNSVYGLAGYVFSNNRDRSLKIIEKLQCGHVGLNSGSGPVPDAPFGGMKQSGFGREGGLEGLYEYVEFQTVVSKE